MTFSIYKSYIVITESNYFENSVVKQLRRSLQMKKIVANAPLYFLLCTATAYKEQTNIYLAR